ncbi:MAG: cysteine synthase family protein [Paludibacter sp.]|nr:cysteine synthase family protein [Paludibacter sp.]
MINNLKKTNTIKELWGLVGNTPMVEIHYLYKNRPGKIYVKLEYYNFSGSIKDRMALYILQEAYKNGKIKQGNLICEATSGNTGIAFSAIGRALGHKVRIIMPNWLSKERVDIIKSLGAEIQLVSKEEGGFIGSIALCEKAGMDENVFLPQQFANENNVNAHFTTTGPEIMRQLSYKNLLPDAIVAGVGTGGTIMGVGNYLKKINSKIRVHPLEPAESPTLSTGYRVGLHRMQGISDEFIPSILKLNQLDSVIAVNDGDAIIAAQKMAEQLGLAIGISSGGNIIGAVKLQQELGKNAIVVTVVADDNKKYLSTDLVKTEPIKENYISTDLQFTYFVVING